MSRMLNRTRNHKSTMSDMRRRISVVVCWLLAGGVVHSVEPRRTTLLGGVKGEVFGTAITGLGDVNGDGYRDVLIAATATGEVLEDRGQLSVFAGSVTGLVTEAILQFPMPGDQPIDDCSLASVRNFDGDGNSHVIVGLPTYRQGENSVGGLAWLTWRGHGPPISRLKTQKWAGLPTRFGACVTAAGDVDGDGFPEVLVTERIGSGGQDRYDIMAVDLLSGGVDSDWGRRRASLIFTNEPVSVARPLFRIGAAGDTDADGFSDVLVSYSPRWSESPVSRNRRVELWRGGPWGFHPAPAWILVPDVDDSFLGADLCGVGNFAGDGGIDIALGEPGSRGNYDFTGRVQIVSSRLTSGMHRPTIKAYLMGRHAYDKFGATVARLGDLNRDGLDDVAVGAPGDDGGGPDAGRVSVFLGWRRRLPGRTVPALSQRRPDWAVDGVRAHGAFGSLVTALGDIDGDGMADFAVASNARGVALGQVDIFYGAQDAYGSHDDPGLTRPLTIETNAGDVVEVDAARRAEQRRNNPVTQSTSPSSSPETTETERNAGQRVVYFLSGTALGMFGLWGLVRWHLRQRRAKTAVEARRRESERFGQSIQQLLVGDLAGVADLPGPVASLALREGLKTMVWSESPDNDSLESVVQFLGQQAERFTAGASSPLRLRLDLPFDVPDVSLSGEWRHRLASAVKDAWIEIHRAGGASEVRLALKADSGIVRVVLEVDRSPLVRPSELVDESGSSSSRSSVAEARSRLFEEAGGRWQRTANPSGGSSTVIEYPLPREDG